jgi:hypothetical protein
MKEIISTLIVTGICLVFAQECKSEDSPVIQLDTIIDNGWLILCGKLIKRPYHFYFENDTFWINEMQYLPAPSDPLQKPAEWVPEYTELGKWYFRTNEIFVDSCRTKYKRWQRKYGGATAMDSLVHWIEMQNLISIKSAEPFGSSMKITYGYRHLDLISNPTPRLTEELSKPEAAYVTIILMFDHSTAVDTTSAPLTQNEIFLNSCQCIMSSLKDGSFLIVTGGSYAVVGRAKGRETEFINSIKEILSKSIPKSQMLYELRTQTQIDSLKAEYIMYNRASWLEGK